MTPWRDKLPVHPAAELIPPMTPDELRALGEDIQQHGLREAIVLYRGKLLDGRCRLDGMELVGIELELKVWPQDPSRFDLTANVDLPSEAVKYLADNADPVERVLSWNLHRRHLPPERKREVIANLLKMYPEKSNRQIAEMAKASHVTVAAVRAELESTGQINQLEKTIGKDGRARTTTPTPHVAAAVERAVAGSEEKARRQPRPRTEAQKQAEIATMTSLWLGVMDKRNAKAEADERAAIAGPRESPIAHDEFLDEQRKAEAAGVEQHGDDEAEPPKRGLVTGVAMAPYTERGLDCYETPVVAVRALIEAETLIGPIWEPACGRGAIVRVLRAAGHRVIATDLVDHGCPDSRTGVDFRLESSAPEGVGTILTNPPFRLANKFVRHALKLAPRVVMLLPLRFLESEGRRDVLDGGQLARVYVFRNRLPMMHRPGWRGSRIKTGAIAFAWFAWDREHRGPPTIHRISWRAWGNEIPRAEFAGADAPDVADLSTPKSRRAMPVTAPTDAARAHCAISIVAGAGGE